MLHKDKKPPSIKAVIILYKKKNVNYSLPDYRLPVFASSLGLPFLGYSS